MNQKILPTAAVLPLLGANAHAADIQRRPNIVFAFADDYGRYASIYGELERSNKLCQLIETPNIDRIAHEGVLFTNAYVNAPSSTPCRSSLFSGRYFWNTGKGAILHGAVWDTNIPTYPLLLEANGYHIGATWKAWAPGNSYNLPYGGHRTGYHYKTDKFNKFSQTVMSADPANYEKVKQELYAEVENNFTRFLDRNRDGRPFCYLWGPTNTHRSWEQGSGKAIWNIDPNDLEDIMPSFIPDKPEIREDFADYLGECQAVDAGLGILLQILEERGELDNTIIVFSGDHGIPGFPRAKTNLYDFGSKVGLAIRYPKTIAPNRVVTDYVSLIDLMPTFLEYGMVDIPEGVSGRSLKGLLESGKSGRVDKERDFVMIGRERHVSDARVDNLGYPQRAIVVEGYKYIRNFLPQRVPIGTYDCKQPQADIDNGPTKTWMLAHATDADYVWHMLLAFGKRPYEELYDLKRDPDEVNNLAYSPKHQKLRKQLSERMDAVLIESKDPRMSEGDIAFDSDEYTPAP